MSPAEVIHRFGEARTKAILRRRLTGDSLRDSATPRDTQGVNRLQLDRLLTVADLDFCEQSFRQAEDQLLIYGLEWPLDRAGRPKWHLFLNGTNTSDTWCFDVNYRESDEIEDDIRLTWELNRLVWLIPIAVHAKAGSNPAAQEYVQATVADFLESDRAGFGARWNSMIELAMQSLTLVVLDALLDRGDGMNLSTT